MRTRDKQKSFPVKIGAQIKLLLWKRYCESTKSKWDIIKVTLPAVLFFVLLILVYSVFNIFSPDGIEPFLVPFAFWIFVQRIVVQIMFEKSSRLQESMRMMGLSDIAYWTSYFISDGVITGFVLSFLCTIFTVGGLFNEANFGQILGLLFVFCLSAVPFAFFLCAFFDTPQTSGQATLALLLGTNLFVMLIFHRCLTNTFAPCRILRDLHRDLQRQEGHHHPIRGAGDLLLLPSHGAADRHGRVPEQLPQQRRRHLHRCVWHHGEHCPFALLTVRLNTGILLDLCSSPTSSSTRSWPGTSRKCGPPRWASPSHSTSCCCRPTGARAELASALRTA